MWLAALILLATPPSPAIQEKLQSRNSMDRGRAAFLAARLADVGNPSELGDTLLRLKKGPPDVRAATLRGLTYRPVPRPLPRDLAEAVLTSLRDPDSTVVVAALQAVAELQPDGATAALLPLLESEGRAPRGAAVRRTLLLAVGRIGAKELAGPLMDLYETAGGGGRRTFPLAAPPREMFLVAAADLGLPEAERVLDATRDVIAAGPDGDFGSLSIGEAIKDLGRPIMAIRGDPVLQIWTARAAISMSDDTGPAFAFLATTIQARDSRLREETVLALASIRDGPSRDRALRILATDREDQSSRIRGTIVQTLSREGSGLAASLTDALDDPYPDIRAEAALGIADAGLAPIYRSALQSALDAETDPMALAALKAAVARSRTP